MPCPRALLALSCILLVVTQASADQVLRDGVYPVRAFHSTSRPGTVRIRAGHRAGEWVEPGPPLAPTTTPVVYATDNGNTTYTLDFRYAPGSCTYGIISLGGAVVASDGYGSSTGECDLFIQLSRAHATAAAAHFGVPRQDRRLIGQSLAGTFAATQATYTAGRPVEIVLSIANPAAAPPVRFQHGGRQRGPRDNQFSFTITRDGRPLAAIDAMDFGGLSQMELVAPGGSVEVRTPLAPWGDVSVPGHYVVECRYETELAPDGVAYGDPAHRGDRWDRAFTGRVTFDVR